LGGPKVTVRIDTPPGEEAQVDFGYAGLMYDPQTQKKRRTWAFIMTLSASRHKFVRFVFRQDTNNWLDCHERAFSFYGGIPRRIILDNLKSGVMKPDIYDPTINRAYADMERHYGFVADPAKIKTPEHKGKVERAVPVVRKHLLAGRTFNDITEANDRALHWCREEIGMEIHGTTKKRPYPTFLSE
jgi:transposase